VLLLATAVLGLFIPTAVVLCLFIVIMQIHSMLTLAFLQVIMLLSVLPATGGLQCPVMLGMFCCCLLSYARYPAGADLSPELICYS
jgi:hypothetical protein